MSVDVQQLGLESLHRSEHWFPGSHIDRLTVRNHLVLGLVGEAGEIANAWKKLARDGFTEERWLHLHDEIIDTLIYLAMLGEELGVEWEEALAANVAKCEARWGPVPVVETEEPA